MPLHFAVPPPDSVAQLVGSLAHDATGPVGITASRSSLPPASQTSPHPVFAVGLDDLVAGSGVEAARLVAWRYLLEMDGGEWAATEVYQVDQGTHRWGSLNRGVRVKGTLDDSQKLIFLLPRSSATFLMADLSFGSRIDCAFERVGVLVGFPIGERSATPGPDLAPRRSILDEVAAWLVAGGVEAAVGDVGAGERSTGLVAISAGGSEPASSHLILKPASPLPARSRGLGR